MRLLEYLKTRIVSRIHELVGLIELNRAKSWLQGTFNHNQKLILVYDANKVDLLLELNCFDDI